MEAEHGTEALPGFELGLLILHGEACDALRNGGRDGRREEEEEESRTR